MVWKNFRMLSCQRQYFKNNYSISLVPFPMTMRQLTTSTMQAIQCVQLDWIQMDIANPIFNLVPQFPLE